MEKSNKALTYAIIAVLSWSTVATSFKIALRYFSHFEMLLVASFSALAIFALAVSLSKRWGDIRKLKTKQWLWFAFIGLLNPVSYYLVLFKAYDLLPAQVAQPINYAWPIVLLVLLAIFAKQRISKLKYIGMFLSLAGVALISFGAGDMSASLPVSGLLLALLSAILWAIYWMLNRQAKTVDSILALFLSFLFGAVYLSIAALIIGVDLSSKEGIYSSLYVGAFEMGIPFIFFGLALRKTENPALVNQICYLAPFISLFLIHLILKEEIYLSTFIGLILIVLGIVFNEYIAQYFINKESKTN